MRKLSPDKLYGQCIAEVMTHCIVRDPSQFRYRSSKQVVCTSSHMLLPPPPSLQGVHATIPTAKSLYIICLSVGAPTQVKNDKLDLRVPEWVKCVAYVPGAGTQPTLAVATGHHEVRNISLDRQYVLLTQQFRVLGVWLVCPGQNLKPKAQLDTTYANNSVKVLVEKLLVQDSA